MSKKVKVVVVGAGSASFGRGTLADLMSEPGLNANAQMEVVLVDLDEAALDRMHRLGLRLKEHCKATAELSMTTDLAQALPGADFVITSVAVERYPKWREDQLMSFAYGFKAPYSENGGPAAAFHTLRSIHLMVPIAEEVARICPDALLLNFTNPESRVCLALNKLTGLKTVGLCHGANATLEIVSGLLDLPADTLEMTIGGINHFHWVMGLKHAATGDDLLPKLHATLDKSNAEGIPPLAAFMYRKFGLLPFPADSHIGEYVSFAYPITGPLPLAPPSDWRAAWIERLEKTASGEEPVSAQVAATTGELAVPIISHMLFDKKQRILSVNVPNTGAAVENLPEHGIVEVPAVVDSSGVTPVKVGPLPEAIAAMCRLQMSVQDLLVEAYAGCSKDVLLQALILDPVVDNAGRAEEMMEEMLRRNSAVLPEFS